MALGEFGSKVRRDRDVSGSVSECMSLVSEKILVKLGLYGGSL